LHGYSCSGSRVCQFDPTRIIHCVPQVWQLAVLGRSFGDGLVCFPVDLFAASVLD
jgi:hypothetical protein